MRFSCTTIYSLERLTQFNNFVAKEKKWMWILLSVCTLVCLASFFTLLAIDDFDLTILICMSLVLFIDVFYLLISFVIPRVAIKKSPALDASVNFEFYNTTFKISAETKTGSESAEHRYNAIIKARQSKNDIYLYVAKQQAYIIDKACLSPENSEQFKAFLEKRNIEFK